MKGYIKIEAQEIPEELRDLPGRHATGCSVEMSLTEVSRSDTLAPTLAQLRAFRFDTEDLAKLVMLFLNPGGKFADTREITMPLIRRGEE